MSPLAPRAARSASRFLRTTLLALALLSGAPGSATALQDPGGPAPTDDPPVPVEASSGETAAAARPSESEPAESDDAAEAAEVDPAASPAEVRASTTQDSAAPPSAGADPSAGPPAADASAPEAEDPAAPVDLVGPDVAAGVLRFELLDDVGRPVPGRLTFTGVDGAPDPVLAVTDGAPLELAVRKNVVYTRSGRGAVRVPAGTFEVFATRGIEWSLHRERVEVPADGEAELSAALRHELDTRGWVSGDFHLHTLTHSGHGDANLPERLISLVGEGVEFAVATDHNHNTDYRPWQLELALEEHFTAVTGNEVSVPVGHFNAFPLDPERPVPPTDATDANELFALLRAEPNEHGVVPVIQLNHPRWLGIDYFNQAGLDPVTREPLEPTFSWDFDSLEVMNGNEAWGYRDADVYPGEVGSTVHWVLGDWYALLDQGRRYTAVGNSDSHTVHFEFAGYPRNFVPSSTDDPAAIEVAEVAEAVRAHRTFTTFGPFPRVTVEGAEPGGSTVAREGRVRVDVELQVASWIDCDRVLLVVNGEVARELPVPDSRDVLRLRTSAEVEVTRDAWLVVIVEGDEPLAPIVAGGRRDVLPLAIVNPVWIDADGDGEMTSTRDWAAAAVNAYESAVALRREVFEPATPTERAQLVLAAAREERPFRNELVRAGLRSAERPVRLAATRLAEELADRSFVGDLEHAWKARELPVFDALAVLRALEAVGSDRTAELFAALARRTGGEGLDRYAADLARVAPGTTEQLWYACGYFPAPEAGAVATTVYGPEEDPDLARVHDGAAWVRRRAGASGFVDLSGLAEAPGADAAEGGAGNDKGSAGGTEPEGDAPAPHENAIAYAQAWLHAPDERTVTLAIGSDDGSRVWVGDALVHEDLGRHGSRPFDAIVEAPLAAGWNRVLVKVENGAGATGFHLRALDDEVTLRATPQGEAPAGG